MIVSDIGLSQSKEMAMSNTRQDNPDFPRNMEKQSLQNNKAGAGQRMNHDQMERNFHNDRDKAPFKGQSTTPPKKH